MIAPPNHPAGDPADPVAVPAPTDYKAICISMYLDDLAELDRMVETLKARGVRRATRSALIRYALAQLDMSNVPPSL